MGASEQMLKAVDTARNLAKEAERNYNMQARKIENMASRNIDLFGRSAVSQTADIVSAARRACDELYACYQMQVRLLDEECRPLLSQNPSSHAVKEVANLIKWLNSESEIKNNFSGSLNGSDLGGLASVRYSPTMENKMVQKYWEGKYAAIGSSAVPSSPKSKSDDTQQKYLDLKSDLSKANSYLELLRIDQELAKISRYRGVKDLRKQCKQKMDEIEKQEAEDARKAEEEKARKLAAKELLRADQEAYDAACAEVEKQRKERIVLRTEEKKQELLQTIDEKIQKEQEELEVRLELIMAELEAARHRLAGLGIFKIGERKAYNEKITRLEGDIAGVQDLIAGLPHKQETQKADVDKMLRSYTQEFRSAVEKELPLPEIPESIRKERERVAAETAALKKSILAFIGSKEKTPDEISSAVKMPEDAEQGLDDLLNEMEARDHSIERMDIKSDKSYIVNPDTGPLASVRREEIRLKKRVAAVLREKEGMELSEIMEKDPVLGRLENQRLFEILRQMCFTDCSVERKDYHGKTYFTLISLKREQRMNHRAHTNIIVARYADQGDVGRLKLRIINVLRRGELMTIHEIMDADPVLGAEPSVRITAIIRQMYFEDFTIVREAFDRKIYFRLD